MISPYAMTYLGPSAANQASRELTAGEISEDASTAKSCCPDSRPKVRLPHAEIRLVGCADQDLDRQGVDERGVGGSCCRNKHGIGARSDGGTADVRSSATTVDSVVVALVRTRSHGCAAAGHAEADDDHYACSQQRLPLTATCGQSKQEDAGQCGAAGSDPPAVGRLRGNNIAGDGVGCVSADYQRLRCIAG